MSHRAMNWALEQRHLKPGPWIVLIKLSDRHNKDTLRVNPEQAQLMDDCNVSRATLNRHLDDLEAAGLLQRVQRMHPVTKKQLSTQYILAIDYGNPPHVEHAVSQFETREGQGETGNSDAGRVSNCDTETVSQKSPIPCLKNGESRVSNRDTKNPVKEPKREPSAREDFPDVSDDPFLTFWAAYPDPVEIDAARQAFDAVVDGGEVTGADLAEAAAVYAKSEKVQQGFGMKPANWLNRGAWRDQKALPRAGSSASQVAEPASPEAVARQMADLVKQGKSYAASAIRPAMARQMLAMGLVTQSDLRAVGVTS